MNILRPRLAACRFMDGFAGSGIMGFEALSRGASHVLAVEANPKQHLRIQHNVEALGLQPSQYESHCTKLEALLAKPNPSAPYDIAYWDAPYELYATLPLQRMMADALTNHWLIAEGQLLIEHPPQWKPSAQWVVTDERSYGDTVVSFLAMPNNLSNS